MQGKLYHKINVKIIVIMLILFTITGTAVGILNLVNLRDIYVKNFTERVLVSNSLMASLVDSEDVNHYVALLRGQDDAFKQRQLQFYYDREALVALQTAGASEAEQKAVMERMESFHREMNALKTDGYWRTLERLKELKEIGQAKYVYVMAETGVVTEDGEQLVTYIFDAEDAEEFVSVDSDGLGTVSEPEASIREIYETKQPMDSVLYHKGEPYGELYYAYAPVFDEAGNVTAVLGTDLEPSGMNSLIVQSMIRFNIAFLAFIILVIGALYLFINRQITKPLEALTGTAQELADGNIYATVAPSVLERQSELGTLAHVINDMISVYQNMIVNRAILDSNPFTCIIFDDKGNVVDCNPRTLEFYRFTSREELNQGYQNLLASAIPQYQPDGKVSVSFQARFKTAFETGYCEFETYLNLHGTLIPLNNVMKRIEYKGKPALVVYQYDLTAQKEIQQKLEYHGKLLQAVGNISDLLLAVDAESVGLILHRAFDTIGRVVDVDRVYLWKNRTGDDGRLFMTQIYEWSPDAQPQQGNELTIDIAYDEVMPSWEATLSKGQCLNNLVKDLGPEEQDQLLPQGIVSILLVPIFIQNKFWGFIGFDDCQKERVFTKTEENILRTCGYMVMVISDAVQNEVAQNLIAAKEDALSSARTKSNFLANMSHEIRTPMNAIMGMTELILHEDTSSNVSSYAADIKNACRGLLSLINDVLDISKIESGKLEIVCARYQISSLLMDVVSIIKMRSDKKNLPFIVNIDAQIPCELVGDEVRIKQILINLLSNAVKFTQDGHIKLSVNGVKTDDGQLAIKFSISDTGSGIQAEDMEKLFESFQQVDTRKNRTIEGTGLGLAISRQLAEMMGGCIEVESEYGAGSTFTMTVFQEIADPRPVAALQHTEKNSALVYESRSAYLSSITYALESLGCRCKTCDNQSALYETMNESTYDYIFVSALYANKIQALAAERQPNAVIVALNGDGSIPPESGIISITMPIHCLQIANLMNDTNENLRSRSGGDAELISMSAPDAKILVVDDNIVNLKVAAGLLKTYGIEADTASSGAQAIGLVKETVYDLVFMDHMMPDMDGIDTTVAIRKLGGDYFSRLPIIALTANAISGAREMFKAEGLDDYLSKPIEMSKLNAILTKWVPKEKQQVRTGEADAAESADLEISGVNVQKGMSHSGGILENYLDILAAYASDGGKRLKEIEQCGESGDFKLLTTYAHALKSASANIGAEDVSHAAAELEFAGKNGDIAYIEKNIKPFISELATVLTNIQCYLDSRGSKTVAPEKSADLDYLKAALAGISASLELVDIETIETELASLRGYIWDEDVMSRLGQMQDCISVFDYDGLEAAVNELKSEYGILTT